MTALPSSPPQAGRPSASLHFAVGEMSGKLDQIMATILPQLADLKAADASFDIRITALEQFRWMVLGIVAAMGGVWAVIQASPGVLTLLRIG